MNLAGNKFVGPIWRNIFLGLIENETLLQLNLSSTNMTLQNAFVLCQAFQINSTVEIELTLNPLPNQFIVNPRQYCIDTKQPLTVNNAKAYQPIASDVIARCISISSAWRKELQRNISTNLDSLR